jgi:hypothetical protein
VAGPRAGTLSYLLFFGLLVLATRVPMAPGQLVTFDDVNLAYSIGHFDVRVSQPQPPGYPLFVMEMRLLYWLHFRRAEHILLALGIAGSIAALLLMCLFGNRMLGGQAGFFAACLMLFHPVFWQTGVASALRMQLAVVSLAVAAACWRAWRGEVRWVLWSAIVLAVGAGIRPETGPLLFPLWAAGAMQAPVTWKARAQALAAMAGVVLLWLLPAMVASGGPITYIKTSLQYVSDQASVSSELFGATQAKAHTTWWRLIVWTGFGILGWAMPAVLAWRRKARWGIDREWMIFLALWFVPSFLFAISVHVEDPGQVLAMVPVVSLFGGYLTSRALDNLDLLISRWHALTLSLATLTVAWIVWFHYGWFLVLWIPPAALAAALLLKLAQVKNTGNPTRLAMFLFLMAPPMILNLTAFNFHGWYYQGESTGGWRASLDQALSDMNTGLELTSREAVEKTLAADDHTLKQLQRLAAERPGQTVVVFEQGMTTWRKAAYYVPNVPVVVLEHKLIRRSPPTMAVWKGGHQEKFAQGGAPLRVELPAGARIVWLLNPRTEFYRVVQQAFSLSAADPVYFTDLPQQSGSRIVGEYELAW